MRTITAGRYVKSVRYQRALPSDIGACRSAKIATASKAQRFINLKNSAEKLQMLLCANFDEKNACFCTFTFSEDNLPVNRKMTRQYFTSFIEAYRRHCRQQHKELLYIYNVEGCSFLSDPAAALPESSQWELRPWRVPQRWENIAAKRSSSKKESVRFHIHAFFCLTKEDKEKMRSLWPHGHIFINNIKVDAPETFYRLSYYVTKEARQNKIPSGSRSYVPSRNLKQPIIDGHWCDAHEVLSAPAGAECVHAANEITDYSNFQYLSYRMPRAKKIKKMYKSKGRVKSDKTA